MKNKITEIWKFLSYDIWRITEHEVTKKTYFLYNVIKTIFLSIYRFYSNRIVIQASALTYSTLLALVPIVAILLAISRGFGFSNLAEKFLRENFMGDQQVVATILELVDSYLKHTQSGIFIGVGLVMLLWTVINLVSNIENAFNNIWEVKEGRSIYRKITDYFSMLLLMPILMVVSGGLSIFVSKVLVNFQEFMLWGPLAKFFIHLVPFILTWLMFTGLYIFMPNTRIQFRHAFVSGIVAGSLYQMFQYLYINSQVWVSSYNAVYGSFAALPLLLLWIQISWMICLFGAELTHSKQNIHHYSFSDDTDNISRRYQSFLSILIMTVITKRFMNNEPPFTANQISDECKIPTRLTSQIVNELKEIGLVNEVIKDKYFETVAYQPALDINQISVAVLLERLDTHGSENFKIDKDKRFSAEWGVLEKSKNEFYMMNREILLKDL